MTESDENVQRVSGFKPVYMGSQQCKEQKAGQQTFITKNGVRPLLMFVHLLRMIFVLKIKKYPIRQ